MMSTGRSLLLFAQFLCLLGASILPFASAAEEHEVAKVDDLSLSSLLLELRIGNEPLAHGTGFIVASKSRHYLISNAHVFSGLNRFKKPIATNGKVPDSIRIWYQGKTLGTWAGHIEKLSNADGSPKWIQLNDLIDVAALPIPTVPQDVTIYPFDLKLADADIVATVGMPAFVIGYPGGLSATGSSTLSTHLQKGGTHVTGMPIWKAGHIATDPDLDYDGLPITLIDATTRGGMSGSPVVVRVSGGFKTKSAQSVLGVFGGPRDLFLGIYSAQYPDLELGHVWKPTVIRKLLDSIK